MAVPVYEAHNMIFVDVLFAPAIGKINSFIKVRMPTSCCIKQCRKQRKDGVSLFRFPFKREDHLKKWLQSIGDLNFKPRKLDVICSAHFQQKDVMSVRGTSGILLKYGAVPTIFPSIPDDKCSRILSKNLVNNSPATFVVPQTLSAPENSIINYSTPFVIKENISVNASAVMKNPKVKKKEIIMNSSTFHFRNQEFSLRKRKMQRQIQILKAKVAQREEKILSLQNLLKQLQSQAAADLCVNGQCTSSLPSLQASQVYVEHLYSLPPAEQNPAEPVIHVPPCVQQDVGIHILRAQKPISN